jgi:hypothetical protein
MNKNADGHGHKWINTTTQTLTGICIQNMSTTSTSARKWCPNSRSKKALLWSVFLASRKQLLIFREGYTTGMKHPSEKVVRETWNAVSEGATSLLREITKAGDVLQGSVATELGWFLIYVDHSDGGLIGRDDCKTQSNNGPQKRLRIAVVAE